jgi:hypothetical protein
MGDSSFEKIITENANFNLESSDGEMMRVSGSRTITSKVYPIKKLNCRVWLSKKDKMDIFKIQTAICQSSKDINSFRIVLLNTNKEHHFTMSALDFSEQAGISRGNATKFLKKCVDNELLFKMVTNKYLVNPFTFTPIGAQKELIYDAQLQWQAYEMKNPDKSKFVEPAQKLIDAHALTSPMAYLLGNDFFMNVLLQEIDGKKLTITQIEALKKSFA